MLGFSGKIMVERIEAVLLHLLPTTSFITGVKSYGEVRSEKVRLNASRR